MDCNNTILIFPPKDLVNLMLSDTYIPPWAILLNKKLISYSLSQLLFSMGYDPAKIVAKQRILDMERQHDINKI